MSTFSNSLDSLAPQSPEIAAIFDAVTIFLLTPPLPTPAPGQPIPPALPTPTAAPSPNQPNPQEMPYASADPAVPAPTPTYGGDVHECSIYFQYVNVYYWPVASSNTDCLSLVSITPLPAIPSGHQMYFSAASPSWSILLTAFLVCRQVFMSFSPQSAPATPARELEVFTQTL